MALTLAERAGLIAPSATLAMATEAKRLKTEGVDVLDFALGEPDFATPENIQEAAIRAIHAGQTHYTPPAGIMELRQAIARHYTARGLATEAAQVVVSNGAKHSIHNALMAVCGPGDEVIIPAPYWVSYSDLVKLTGATPVVIATPESDGFKLSPQQLRAAITPRSKVLMINSPSNPTGVVYTRGELAALADVVLETDHLGVLSDEIYEQLLYGDAEATCFATLRPALAARTITISGVSKTYAMTGWRIGWSVAPTAVAKFMADLQSQETSNPCSVSQHAALEAVVGPQQSVAAMLGRFADRRAYVLKRIAELPGVTCVPPGGAFYAFMNISAHLGRTLGGRVITDSTAFCLAALASAHVALVMGSAFGAEGYARLSFATDLTTLERGFDAMEKFLQG
jgi:aspartate aminotransferase